MRQGRGDVAGKGGCGREGEMWQGRGDVPGEGGCEKGRGDVRRGGGKWQGKGNVNQYSLHSRTEICDNSILANLPQDHCKAQCILSSYCRNITL